MVRGVGAALPRDLRLGAAGDELGQEFYNAHAPFAEYQLVLSGYRLAKVLNALFDR